MGLESYFRASERGPIGYGGTHATVLPRLSSGWRYGGLQAPSCHRAEEWTLGLRAMGWDKTFGVYFFSFDEENVMFLEVMLFLEL